MGRIKDPRLVYSVIDTDYAQKESALRIRIRFGLLGHLVLHEVIGWINGGKGCYAEYTEGTAASFAMTRLGALEHAEKIDEIFRFMIEIGFFDRRAFREDQILTSEGIVKRWAFAKKRPESYDLPNSVKRILDQITDPRRKSEKISADDIPENDTENGITADDIPGTGANIPQSKVKICTKEKKKKRPEINPAEIPEKITENNSPENTEKKPVEIETAKADPRWGEIRGRIARSIYEPGLSADLTDAITAAAVRKWITVSQLNAWLREARDEKEVNRRTDQRFGKKKRWQTLRPWIEQVYLAHNITLPKCDPRRKEPPPPPENAPGDTELARTAAGRALVPK